MTIPQVMLAGWYVLLTILAALTALSAGPRTWQGLLALAGGLAAGALLVTTVFGVPGLPVLANHWTTVTVALAAVPLGVGLILLVLAPRQDTKLIALLLAGASILPLVSFFWHPGQ